jgi:hypothetical protein
MILPTPPGPRSVEYALARILATCSTHADLARMAGLPPPDDDWPAQLTDDQYHILVELIRRRISSGELTTADRPRRKGGAA